MRSKQLRQSSLDVPASSSLVDGRPGTGEAARSGWPGSFPARRMSLAELRGPTRFVARLTDSVGHRNCC